MNSYLPYDLVERAAAQGYQHAAYRLRDMTNSISFGLSKYGRIFTEGMKTTAKIRDLQKVNKEVQTWKKIADYAKKITDNLKTGAFKSVNPSLATTVSVGTTLFSAGLTVLAIKSQEEIQEIDLRKEIVVSSEFNTQLKLITKNYNTTRKLEESIKKNELKIEGLEQTFNVINGYVAQTRDIVYNWSLD
ncbi:hypothetical protein [Tolypothrix sp. VBCCA 56010]|uniref:hypothetical protein n=1 Tax=Tolypothrix sp. VBCCA 56010 TaxID=3137731 RepID=UPI003D7D746B